MVTQYTKIRNCKECGVELIRGDNWKKSGKKHGNYRCKACDAAFYKKYYAKNREKLLQYQKDYISNGENKEKVRGYQRGYYIENKEKLMANMKEYYADNRENIRADQKEYYIDRGRDKYLQAQYGITLDQYYGMLEEQGGVCEICKRTPGENGHSLHVDHDHETNKNRGLLCRLCNAAIGMLQDNPELCETAACYLRRYKK